MLHLSHLPLRRQTSCFVSDGIEVISTSINFTIYIHEVDAMRSHFFTYENVKVYLWEKIFCEIGVFFLYGSSSLIQKLHTSNHATFLYRESVSQLINHLKNLQPDNTNKYQKQQVHFAYLQRLLQSGMSHIQFMHVSVFSYARDQG